MGLVVLVDTFYHLLAPGLAPIAVEEGFVCVGDEECRCCAEGMLLVGSNIVFIKSASIVGRRQRSRGFRSTLLLLLPFLS